MIVSDTDPNNATDRGVGHSQPPRESVSPDPAVNEAMRRLLGRTYYEEVAGLPTESATAHLLTLLDELSLGLAASEGDIRRVYTLSRTQAKILLVLRWAEGRAVSTGEIMEALYGNRADMPAPRIIAVMISKIRQKLEEADAPFEIKTEFGQGYAYRPKGTRVR